MAEKTSNPDNPERTNPDSAPETTSTDTTTSASGINQPPADHIPGMPDDNDDSLRQMLAGNFLEYASYVIKERAIPNIDDGMKPVQRRILHSLHVMDDGRFHKVANVIGHTMQYHPHGDQSIGSALVVLANKEYFIDRQGNFGNILTGDPASAARYIECRLTDLAREVLFNPEITDFIDSYDGRNKEPVTLPAKVPSLLMLGADGIAVGMTTRVLPHNFGELLEAQIAILRNRSFTLYPDFLQGGFMDVSEYDDGQGRVILRAQIEADTEKRLLIREVPATTTTESLISSIEDAARKNKIKIASINDYTAEEIEIEILLPRGAYADETIKQLYAYTDCEVSISSNIVVIRDAQPVELTVSEVLKHNTDKLLEYLRRELEIHEGKLEDRFHQRTLAQLFIENRLYKRIEEAETYESVMAEVQAGLEPFRDQLKREVTDEDIDKLLQLQIRRISRFDINRNQEELDKIVADLKETRHQLKHLVDYTVNYLQDLLEKYAKRFPRKTRIKDIEQVDAREVALRNLRVGHDRMKHFVGTEVRNSNKADSPLKCSEFDRLVLLRNDGTFKVIPVPDKVYVGPVKYLLRADKEQVYSILYRNRKTDAYYAKRFCIDSYIMDKEYSSLPEDSLIEALYTNHGVVLSLKLTPNTRRKVDEVILNFDDIDMRSTLARGFKVTGYPVDNVLLVDRGNTDNPEDDDDEEDADGAEQNTSDHGDDKDESAQDNSASEARDSQAHSAGDDGDTDAPADDPDEDGNGTSGNDHSSRGAADSKPSASRRKQPSTADEDKKPASDDKAGANGPAEPPGQSAAEKQDKAAPGKREELKKLKKLIDEETPFFLE